MNIVIQPGIDQGPLITGYLGLILAAGAFLAIGTAISSLFANQVASYITTFGLIVLFWWIMGILGQASSGSLSSIFQYLDMASHFYNQLYTGVLELSSIVYYISLIAASLVLGSVSVETRRWR